MINQQTKQFCSFKEGDLLKLNQDMVYYLQGKLIGEDFINAGTIVMFLREFYVSKKCNGFRVLYNAVVVRMYLDGRKPSQFCEKVSE